MIEIKNQSLKVVGNIFIVLSLIALTYSINAFTNTHPLHATFLTLDSVVFLICAIGLRQLWRWTVYVFTLFWINAAIAYYLTVQAGLEHAPVYLTVIVALLTVYYVTVLKHWRLFKTRASNQTLRP